MNSARANAACHARRSLSAGSFTAWRLGRMTRSHPVGIPSRLNRASSLKRRLQRLRTTAAPIFFPAMTTYRVRPHTFPRYRSVKRGPDRRLPSLKTIRISALLRRRYCEAERRWATDPIRPSTYAALWPDGEPEPGAHPLISFSRGIHGCAYAPYSMVAASWRTCSSLHSRRRKRHYMDDSWPCQIIEAQPDGIRRATGCILSLRNPVYAGTSSSGAPPLRARSSVLIFAGLNFSTAFAIRSSASSNGRGAASFGRNRMGLIRATTKLFR